MRASQRQLRQIARRTLRDLGLRPPLELGELAARLGEQRGKPIHLVPSYELPPTAAFGVTGGDETQDVVLFEVRTSTTSQLLIVLHELAHIILEHPRTAVDHSFRTGYEDEYEMLSSEVLAELVSAGPTASDVTASAESAAPEESDKRRRWRWPWRISGPRPPVGPGSLYAADIEWEAETLATILLTWVPDYGGYVPPPQHSPLEEVLGDDGAW